MYRSAHTQAELLQQLSLSSVSTDSTEQLLRLVLGEVQELKVQQQQLEALTAEAVQHAMAAAAASAAAQQQQGQLSGEGKVREHALFCCSVDRGRRYSMYALTCYFRLSLRDLKSGVGWLAGNRGE